MLSLLTRLFIGANGILELRDIIQRMLIANFDRCILENGWLYFA